VIVAGVEEATPAVVTVKFMREAFAGTTIVAGMVAAAVAELDSVTDAPAGGALPVKVRVPVAGSPPTTLAGASVRLERLATVVVSGADFVTPA
jgi:hypothetical protein